MDTREIDKKPMPSDAARRMPSASSRSITDTEPKMSNRLSAALGSIKGPGTPTESPRRTFASPQELESIRAKAAKDTMSGGYSSASQELMSNRTKAILGGRSVYGGRNVLQQPSTAPRPTAPTGGSQQPTAPTAPTGTPRPTAPTGGLSPEQLRLYKQAYDNRNNPLAKGRIQGGIDKLTPEQRKAFQDYAQSQGQDKDWSGYKFEHVINKLSYFNEMNSHISNFELWVDGLLSEGHDLSDYTWNDMYDLYLDEGYGMYEYVMDYLISEGYAEDTESAVAIMANMSEEWKESIVEELITEGPAVNQKPSPFVYGRGGIQPLPPANLNQKPKVRDLLFRPEDKSEPRHAIIRRNKAL